MSDELERLDLGVARAKGIVVASDDVREGCVFAQPDGLHLGIAGGQSRRWSPATRWEDAGPLLEEMPDYVLVNEGSSFAVVEVGELVDVYSEGGTMQCYPTAPEAIARAYVEMRAAERR